jgi:hypothetical protein
MYQVTRGYGLGDAAHASQVAGIIGSTAAGATTGILATVGLTSLVPIVGPALGAAVMAVQYLIANSGCGQTCVITSQWANQAADALQKVLDGYFALPAPRTQSQQAVAIAAFNSIWAQLQKLCGQPGTGDAGVRCITDRQAGACTWKQKYAPVYPGEPNIGECWNWFNGYLAPIQQDPTVPDPTPVDQASAAVSSSLSSIFGPSSAAGGSNLLPLAIIGGLVALAVAS